MNKSWLFTDGSVNPQSKVGYGAILWVTNLKQAFEERKSEVQIKRFENTSSTKLELQTLLWALNEIEATDNSIIVYTDSQNLVGLPGRRARLEANNYRSKKNELIQNAKLYKEFYKLLDQLKFEIIKVKGHQQTKNKNEVDTFFTLVDRASRNALRNIT